MPSPFGTRTGQLRLAFAMVKLLQETHNFILSLILSLNNGSPCTHTHNQLGSRLSWKLTWKFKNSLTNWEFKKLTRAQGALPNL
jgi:hypothetical protein